MIDRAGIEALIPHGGAMVLLDRVVSHDETRILCSTMSHRRADNPLLRDQRLPTVVGAEYGAQAAAVHGALLADEPVRPGRVVLLRAMSWTRQFLEDIPAPIEVHAESLHRDAGNIAYGFALIAEGDELLHGECGIILS